MMKSRLFKDTPRQDQERTKVLTVWNSKKYTYQLKISHTVEEKDGSFYVRLYAGKLEIRRCKFEKDKKRKVASSQVKANVAPSTTLDHPFSYPDVMTMSVPQLKSELNLQPVSILSNSKKPALQAQLLKAYQDALPGKVQKHFLKFHDCHY